MSSHKRQSTAFYAYDTPPAPGTCRWRYPGLGEPFPKEAWEFFCREGFVVFTDCVPRHVIDAANAKLLKNIKSRLVDPAVAASIKTFDDLREEHLPGNGSRNIRRSEGFSHLAALHDLRRRPEPLHVGSALHQACGGVPAKVLDNSPEGKQESKTDVSSKDTINLLPSIDALFLGVRANRTTSQRLNGNLPPPPGGDYSGACTLHSDQAPTWSSAHGAQDTMKVAGTLSLSDTLACPKTGRLVPGAGATILVPRSHNATEDYALELLLSMIKKAATSNAKTVESMHIKDLDLARSLCRARGWVKEERRVTEYEALMACKGRLDTSEPKTTTVFHSHFVDYSQCTSLARRLAKQAVAVGLRKGDYLVWNNRMAHTGMPGLRRALCLTYAPKAWADTGLMPWRYAAFLCGCNMINHPDVRRAFIWREFHFARRPPGAHALKHTPPGLDDLAATKEETQVAVLQALVAKYRTVPAMAAAIEAGKVSPKHWLLPWQVAYCEGLPEGYVQY